MAFDGVALTVADGPMQFLPPRVFLLGQIERKPGKILGGRVH